MQGVMTIMIVYSKCNDIAVHPNCLLLLSSVAVFKYQLIYYSTRICRMLAMLMSRSPTS